MIGQAVKLVDDIVGDGIESAVRAHHRRRLRRIDWERALDADGGLWCAGDPPPRAGNDVSVFIDGEEALPALAEALEGAQSHVFLAGWYFSPGFALRRDGQPSALGDVLKGLSKRGVDVRVLMWAGAPLPLFTPSRADARTVRNALVQTSGVRCALDDRERPMHCHHEKIVVVDDELAFVGGIDLTHLDGDRFDARAHPLRGGVGWHDAAARIRGPAVADVADHFRLRWREVTREDLGASPVPDAAGDVELQVVRTVPERVYDALPRGDFRILEAYTRALRSAQRFIYLESQFLWSPEIVELLREKLQSPPTPDFRVVVLLPAKPNNGEDDTKGQLGELAEADPDDERLLACTLYARAGGERMPVYVHAKIGIVDDEWLTLGSANLNEHSLFNDTEMNLVFRDPGLARDTRERLWAEHLELERDEIAGLAPVEVVDRYWQPIAREQKNRLQHDHPLTHRLVRLPHVSRRARRLLGPIQSLLVDG